ncbi:MAG: hypothetical protein ABSB84_06020 [Verrucomicrobiota bacterium]|jgi:hypothetical protein
MPAKDYQRLTYARSRSAFVAVSMSRSSLWLGKDHLLGVDSSGYTETYKRFYFRDIQAVTLMGTKRRAIWNWVLGLLTAIFLLFLLASLPYTGSTGSNSNLGEIVFFAFLGFVFAVPFLINNLLGPSCICHLRTAVQIEELPSLCRVRKTRRVLEQIRPLIIAAQGGQLSPETISTWMRAGVQTSPVTAPPETATDNPNAPPVIS